ncbi:hypothetical protein C1H46_015915 [Malus baccata]|uniref:Uncharacterized protein n=1 Tax=Malus baccata TaxID=106549 RepID=A0A540MI42_MALBA|nr:hypothetical protein C1H46_015915 [Malus baccata]
MKLFSSFSPSTRKRNSRRFGKHHDDDSATFRSNPKFQESFGFFRSELARKNEKVFDLLDKQVEDFVTSPPFLDSVGKINTAKDLVSRLLISELLERKDELPSSQPILENKVGFQLIVYVGSVIDLEVFENAIDMLGDDLLVGL